MMRPILLFLAGAIFALSACSSNGDVSPILSGTYTGTYTSFQNGYQGTISLVIPNATSDAAFSWSATGSVDADGSDSPFSLTGTGEYVFPDILFIVQGTGTAEDRTLIGTVSGDGTSISASQNTVLIGTATEERFDVTR